MDKPIKFIRKLILERAIWTFFFLIIIAAAAKGLEIIETNSSEGLSLASIAKVIFDINMALAIPLLIFYFIRRSLDYWEKEAWIRTEREAIESRFADRLTALEEQEKELESREQAIAEDVIGALFKKWFPDPMYRGIKSHILSGDILQKEANITLTVKNPDSERNFEVEFRNDATILNLRPGPLRQDRTITVMSGGKDEWKLSHLDCVINGKTVVDFDEDRASTTGCKLVTEDTKGCRYYTYSVEIPEKGGCEIHQTLSRIFRQNVFDNHVFSDAALKVTIRVLLPNKSYQICIVGPEGQVNERPMPSLVEQVFDIDGPLLPYQGFAYKLVYPREAASTTPPLSSGPGL